MTKRKFKTEHKIGITAIVCVLTGIVIAFAYMYMNGNKIVVMQKYDDSFVPKKTNNKKYNDSLKKTYPPQRYTIYNYYYTKGNQPTFISKTQTDVLPSQKDSSYYHYQVIKKDNIVLDLNTCDTLDLQMIRGIGPTYSKRIYRYREKLGGFVTVEQLREVYGMSDTLYTKIRKHFTIGHTAIRKLNINTASLKDIAAHPYLDYFLAKEIILFRQNHGPITDIDQLQAIHLMDDTTFYKIKPYISLD